MDSPPPGDRIGVFTMGGTISSTRDPAASEGGAVPRLSATDLVAAVPGLNRPGTTLELHDVRRMPSSSFAFSDIYALLDTIEQQPGLTGAVVTQGTDTMEETSWLLDLLYEGQAPIVITGAMRTPDAAGSDGPANLLAATLVAACPDAWDLGVLVVLNDEIHAARTVRKAHSTSTAAFVSPDTGPIGRIIEGKVTIFNRPLRVSRTLKFPRSVTQLKPRVPVVPMTLGEDDAVLRAVAAHADGLVLIGFGAGNAPTRVVPVLTELARRLPVVLTTRTAAGPVTTNVYGYPGSGSDLVSRGLINAGYLGPYKAHILLSVLLASGADLARITQAFDDLGSAPLSTSA